MLAVERAELRMHNVIMCQREEAAHLKAELRAQEQRDGMCLHPVHLASEQVTGQLDAEGRRAGDGAYLKNIVLGYIEKTVLICCAGVLSCVHHVSSLCRAIVLSYYQSLLSCYSFRR